MNRFALKGQLTIDDFLDPFKLYVLPRFAGRPVFEKLKVITLKIAFEQGEVTADDLRPHCPPNTNRKVLGAVIGALKRAGYLEPIAPTRTGVPSSHGRVIWKYRLTEEGRKFLEKLQEVEE